MAHRSNNVGCAKEKDYWREIITGLQAHLTVAQIAEKVIAHNRSVWGWKHGDSRPSGVVAVRLYLLHVKLCNPSQCEPWHINYRGERIVS